MKFLECEQLARCAQEEAHSRGRSSVSRLTTRVLYHSRGAQAPRTPLVGVATPVTHSPLALPIFWATSLNDLLSGEGVDLGTLTVKGQLSAWSCALLHPFHTAARGVIV